MGRIVPDPPRPAAQKSRFGQARLCCSAGRARITSVHLTSAPARRAGCRNGASRRIPSIRRRPFRHWLGTWRHYDDKIVLKHAGDILNAEGEAYWPGKNVMPANEGALAGTAKPAGNRLHFGGGAQGCEVDMALAGSFLVVADNHGCGGHNVSFTGIYTRRGQQAR